MCVQLCVYGSLWLTAIPSRVCSWDKIHPQLHHNPDQDSMITEDGWVEEPSGSSLSLEDSEPHVGFSSLFQAHFTTWINIGEATQLYLWFTKAAFRICQCLSEIQLSITALPELLQVSTWHLVQGARQELRLHSQHQTLNKHYTLL